MKNIMKTLGVVLFALISLNIAIANSIQDLAKSLESQSDIPLITYAAYDNGRSAFFGNAAGEIFSVNKFGVTKYDVPIAVQIDSIAVTDPRDNNLGNITFIADKKVWTYNIKNSELIDLQHPATPKTLNYNTIGLYCKDSSGIIFRYHNLEWLRDDNGKVLFSSEPPLSSIKSLQKGSSISLTAQPEALAARGPFYLSASAITDTTAPSDTTVTIDYVSDAKNSTDDAIYRITIKNAPGLDQDQLFTKGYNGIKYALSCGTDGTYNSIAHPIVGYTYDEDGTGSGAILTPRDISFLWKGPKEGKPLLQISQYVHDFNNNVDASLFSNQYSLQAVNKWQPTDAYSIAIDYDNRIDPNNLNVVNCYSNGVCATSFKVTIKNGNSALPATDEAYKHLSFYANDQSGAVPSEANSIIGCNPYDTQANCIAILPQEYAETTSGIVKYGYSSPFATTTGKVFYLFAGSKALNNSISVYLSDNGDIVPPATINIKLNSDIKLTCTATGDTSTGGTTFSFADPNLNVSSWEGMKNGDYRGYLDYICPDSPSYKGIFALIPQGLNTLSLIPDRLNLSTMKTGFYIQPNNSNSDGLHATQYTMDAKTSYCSDLRGKTLYAFLFDEYGRYGQYSFVDGNSKAKEWSMDATTTSSSKNGYIKITLTNWSKVPICMYGQNYQYDDNGNISANLNTLGASSNSKGVFMPPTGTDNSGVQFLTDIHSDVSNGNVTVFYMYGCMLCHTLGTGTAADPCYDYFQTSFAYHNIGNMEMSAWTGINISDTLSNYPDYNNKCLPLNQILYYNHNWNDICLLGWGVHFVPWNLSGLAASAIPRHECMDDDDYITLFGQVIHGYTYKYYSPASFVYYPALTGSSSRYETHSIKPFIAPSISDPSYNNNFTFVNKLFMHQF